MVKSPTKDFLFDQATLLHFPTIGHLHLLQKVHLISTGSPAYLDRIRQVIDDGDIWSQYAHEWLRCKSGSMME